MILEPFSKNKKILAGIGVAAVILLIGGVWMATANKATQKEASNINVSAIKTFEECNGAGFPTVRHYPDQCQTPDGRIFINGNPPSENEIAQTEQSIRTFMGDPNLELQYISQGRHPSNFAVLSNVKANEGGLTADNPEEWDRPIYIFQQTDYINDRCEVYEYEVLIKTKQVVQVGVRYPEEAPMTPDERTAKCKSYGSLEIPLKTKTEIEQDAFAYLGRDPEHTKFMLRSDIQPEYIPSKKGTANPAMNEWKWEDKNYKLPEGLMGDPSPYPTMRIILSSGGKLVYYLNTTDLFAN